MKFITEANNNSKRNVYIWSAMVDGKPFTHNWISHAKIKKLGLLLNFDVV
jgi:putative alpha-1,2-mannosidase